MIHYALVEKYKIIKLEERKEQKKRRVVVLNVWPLCD